MSRVIGCLELLVVGLLVAASVVTAGVLAVGRFVGQVFGVSTWEAAVLIVLVAAGLVWLVSGVVGPAWLPNIGLEEADEGEAPARSETLPPAPERRGRRHGR